MRLKTQIANCIVVSVVALTFVTIFTFPLILWGWAGVVVSVLMALLVWALNECEVFK